MSDFLIELAKKIKRNTTAHDNYERMHLPPSEIPSLPEGVPLRTNVLYKHIQNLLTSEHAVIAETGDSWFNCQKLRLPEGCKYEFQVRSMLCCTSLFGCVDSTSVCKRLLITETLPAV